MLDKHKGQVLLEIFSLDVIWQTKTTGLQWCSQRWIHTYPRMAFTAPRSAEYHKPHPEQSRSCVTV